MPIPGPDDRPPAGEPLPALAGRLGYLLKHAQLRLSELTGSAMAPFGITGRQCAVLIAIDSQAPLSQQEVAGRLDQPLRKIEAVGRDFLRASGMALRARTPPPRLDAVEIAFREYIEAFGAVRQERLTRDMPSEAAERFFALGFALEQLREHLFEVQRVIGEWARD